MHTYLHTYMHACIHIYLPTYMHAWMHTYYVPKCMHAHLPTYLPTCKHAYRHTYLPTYLHTYIHIYIYTYTHTHTYIYYMHANTHSNSHKDWTVVNNLSLYISRILLFIFMGVTIHTWVMYSGWLLISSNSWEHPSRVCDWDTQTFTGSM
jgi:hypothetical protein